jgi:hypothetical protein
MSNFCGTQALEKRMKLRGFGMHCQAMSHQIALLRHERPVDRTEAGDQYRMFTLTNDERAQFAKLAKNLRLLTEEHTIHDAAYWQLYRDTDYNNYEFFKMLDGHEEEAKPVIAALEKIAGGEKLTEEETKIASEFLYRLGCRSDSMVDDGGCF